MADGKFIMNPGEARVRANEMTKIASELEMLLNDISRKMEEIDNVDTGVYQGDKKPAELRAELDQTTLFVLLIQWKTNNKKLFYNFFIKKFFSWRRFYGR